MGNSHGDFIWYELIAPDPDAATRFYEAVTGWTIANPGNDGFDYREISAGSEHVGGMLKIDNDMAAHGAKPAWIGYIAVDDVDAAVAKVEAEGGRVTMPARDMEGIGRFAMVADPQGAPFYLMRPTPPADRPDKQSHAFSVDRPGHVSWNELTTSDPAAARAFYGDLFGWSSDEFMPMGEMGEYRFLDHDGTRIGALCGTAPGQQPKWRYFVRVASIGAAKDSIESNGGAVAMGPQEVPGGDHIIIAKDPQGAEFALVGPA
jgi:predicted enzyme related to lactoylglutathione lyase